VEVRPRRLDARHLAGGEQTGEVGGGKPGEVGAHCSSPRIEVTLNWFASLAGAPASACSGLRVSPTTSGRVTVPSGTGWLVAGTSGVATSLTFATESTM